MITYKNSYAVGNKFYADIIARKFDMMAGNEMSMKIYVDAFEMMDKYGH